MYRAYLSSTLQTLQDSCASFAELLYRCNHINGKGADVGNDTLGRANFWQHRQTLHLDCIAAKEIEHSQQFCISPIHGITSNQKKGGNLVQWRSSWQDLIAKSTCEAELIASSEVLQREHCHCGGWDDEQIMWDWSLEWQCSLSTHGPEWIRDSVANPPW